jgi:hypothetical protein
VEFIPPNGQAVMIITRRSVQNALVRHADFRVNDDELLYPGAAHNWPDNVLFVALPVSAVQAAYNCALPALAERFRLGR